ncbi:ead/Ea22-like family protein [Enterobacter bugandensis]|uniref:ead/Ea22-like family protein n=1 Tax=Enterobacter bugandensis TaxID=881260 RepID=UPI003BE2AFE1
MSNIDKRALREAAEKATPGRWEYYPGNTSIEYNVDSMDEDQGSIVYVDSGDFTQKQTDLNGTFIAAANPSNVLALLDELEAAEKRIAELEARKVRVKLPRPGLMTTGNHGFAKNDVLAALREAGIKLEVGE